ncbi:hypothetical protein E1A91_D11G206000v1 [Gossypium mustelinum]|uniref:Uncharacterized protein n=1 Tax=Gossypium mustelinum TaxID=34275 RepID=A0A5D2SVC3_GOSMU|nr:hypothetical protein E1A91_D11G206000v1 [Gossypium mustelinum]
MQSFSLDLLFCKNRHGFPICHYPSVVLFYDRQGITFYLHSSEIITP